MLQPEKMFFPSLVALAAMVLFTGATQALTYETVLVGNAGNAADTFVDPDDELVASFGDGAVAYEYNIGKFEVTAGQYTELLNAVAAADPYGLYNPAMQTPMYDIETHISRSGSDGSYTYSVPAQWANRPVNFVSWADAARFANWMHNGQPTGVQDITTTEDGIVLSQRGSGWYRSSVNST